MTEELLHYAWKFRMFDRKALCTDAGEELEIIDTGQHNKDAGPDFFNARIRIAGTLWAGNVEVHIRASDWERHRHTIDRAYDNTILHVVFINDKPVLRSDGSAIPVLSLERRIDLALYERYLQLARNRAKIPCSAHLPVTDPFIIRNWMQRLAVERLQYKADLIRTILTEYGQDLHQTFYHALARSFGQKVNTLPFEMLARSLPYRLLEKHKDQLLQIEALLFGQAGMLEEKLSDAYGLSLQQEYSFLRKKYKLKPLDKSIWKLLRLRPSNFPAIRISQLAALIHEQEHLLSRLTEMKRTAEMQSVLKVHAHEYWSDHTDFDRSCKKHSTAIGEEMMRSMLINIIPAFLYLQAEMQGRPELVRRALALSESLSAENNAVTREFSSLNLKAENAWDSQALIHLKTFYCDKKRCLDCGIGIRILSRQAD